MASPVEGRDGCSPNTKKPLFFKFITDSTPRDGKLGLPVKFVKRYGKEMSSAVQLKVPNGDNGFRCFMEHYSLTCGSLLVFQYEGNYLFNVYIFDESATEIAYPLIKNKQDKVDECGPASSDGSSVEILDEFSFSVPSKKSEKEPPFPCPKQKMMSTSHAAQAERGTQDLVSGSGSLNGAKEKIMPLTDDKKALVLQRARDAFTSELPFFLVAMQPSSLQRYNLHIPGKFSKKYLQNFKGAPVKLQVAGTSWPMKIVQDGSNCVCGVSFSSGWSEFAKQNHLQVGDVCVFEQMTGDKTLLFNVSIIRFDC
ncbi:hypothetical protein Tsubulata_036776 [Turnera subulata]|uniref:TF-B3 domain-containing protein n=1 Tax=Turnera subulata TaxID=218843 RepID=A0A9Q0IWE8_9ROSI|nr:hypothetical protein Tsubulata_036776 [Turnera subulata]